jgi:hypothetical protein
MARPNIAHYERSKNSARRPLDPASLAKAAGLTDSPAFRRLAQDVEDALLRYDFERGYAKDHARDLLAGVASLRDRLNDALGAYRRLAGGHYEEVFDELVLDALGEDGLRPFRRLEDRLQAAADSCDAVLLPRSKLKIKRFDWSGTVFDAPDPRQARRRLAVDLATVFQRHVAANRWRSNLDYWNHLQSFLGAIFKSRRISWPRDRTGRERLIPKALRRPL